MFHYMNWVRSRSSRFIGIRVATVLLLLLTGIAALPDIAAAAGAAAPLHAHGGEGTSGYWIKETAVFSQRAIYFAMLLATAGTMLTFLAVPPGDRGNSQRKWMEKWSSPLSKAMLLAILVHVFVQSNRIASGLDSGLSGWLRVFTETSSGQAWLVLIALAIIGQMAIRLPDVWKAAWALLLLAAESFVGHPAGADELTLAVMSDFVHLACSSIWVSGVMLLLLFWKADRKEAGRFAETFSAMAWLMIVILAITGAAMAWLLLPDWTALWRGSWGRWLLAKSALVLLVVAIGFALRRRARRGELPRSALLKLDGLAMAAIIIVAAVFTTISPAPPNDPVNYHRMGNDLHFTLRIEPNASGPNDVELQIWLPEDKGEPANVAMELIPVKAAGKAVRLEMAKRPAGSEIPFPGYTEYRYAIKDAELEGAGNWTARMNVQLADGTELVREADFKLGY
ncbi:MAG: copper resistance protein CopC [Paenibacillus sp.]|nr:copper resistance protein CopC [Paenibacillus sp.]